VTTGNSATSSVAVTVDKVEFSYGDRLALDAVSFEVREGEIFGLLGPNGGGKTTLFRILSTLAMPASGSARLLGYDLATDQQRIRENIGVVFQQPSVDNKLTIAENLRHHGQLYSIAKNELTRRIVEILDTLGLADRADEACETLSGGLKRRVELAKGLLPRPRLLILDEPSTALDPGARIDLWHYLGILQQSGTTVLLTTHLLEEAERCNRIAIIDEGRIVCIDTPDALRSSIGGDILTIDSSDPQSLSEKISQRFGEQPQLIGGSLRIERDNGHRLLRDLVEAFPDEIDGISVGKPTLEDVFVRETGHRFWSDA
jgi:ABC-2 type transport system ATP-binding protein